MTVFSCAGLGNRCTTTLTAQTEELLTELASIHLREVHGMASLTPDFKAKLTRLFVNRASRDAAGVVDRIFEKYNCDREPECTWRYISEAEMILTGGRMAHERELTEAEG